MTSVACADCQLVLWFSCFSFPVFLFAGSHVAADDGTQLQGRSTWLAPNLAYLCHSSGIDLPC